jgi:hypothetical protein
VDLDGDNMKRWEGVKGPFSGVGIRTGIQTGSSGRLGEWLGPDSVVNREKRAVVLLCRRWALSFSKA